MSLPVRRFKVGSHVAPTAGPGAMLANNIGYGIGRAAAKVYDAYDAAVNPIIYGINVVRAKVTEFDHVQAKPIPYQVTTGSLVIFVVHAVFAYAFAYVPAWWFHRHFRPFLADSMAGLNPDGYEMGIHFAAVVVVEVLTYQVYYIALVAAVTAKKLRVNDLIKEANKEYADVLDETMHMIP